VTFRCSRRVIDFANRAFPELLNGEDDQAKYVSLLPFASAAEGLVARIKPEGIDADRSELKKAHAEADWLAHWLAETGYQRLGARSWEQVAILCPRNRWLGTIHDALTTAGLRSQVHSVRETYADRAPYAWLAAVLTVLCEPGNAFETVGVLREVFGISDEELALYSSADAGKFHPGAAGPEKGVIAETLKLLSQLRAEIVKLPLRKAVDVILERIQFRNRLLSIADQNTEEVDSALHHLLQEASTAEKNRSLFPEFAQYLRNLLESSVQTTPPHRDAIQLLNSKKAKGGEWDVVIVPYLWRRSRTTRESSVVSTRLLNDLDDETLQVRERQEWIRLLYVTMTRARHSLFLVEDAALFRPKKSTAKTASFGELLGDAVLNDIEILDVLPAAKAAMGPDAESADIFEFPFVDADVFVKAREVSESIVRKTLPHALASHALPEDPELRIESDGEEFRPVSPLAMQGVAYGTWWHEVMHWLPWRDRAAWQSDFDRAVVGCPMKDRAIGEWQKFLRSPLADLLSAEDTVIHTEFPFIWKKSESQCLEGIMDMAVWKPVAQKWILVDWKTDRETSESELLARYRPQIEAYGHALRAATGANVEGGLYSTVLGKWLPL
ncbi:MAG: PD-(D/E)XK nuclease family protein, partial [Chthoniobacterales bacterium]